MMVHLINTASTKVKVFIFKNTLIATSTGMRESWASPIMPYDSMLVALVSDIYFIMRSRSSSKVRVKYEGHFFLSRYGHFGGINVSQTQLVLVFLFLKFYTSKRQTSITVLARDK